MTEEPTSEAGTSPVSCRAFEAVAVKGMPICERGRCCGEQVSGQLVESQTC